MSTKQSRTGGSIAYVAGILTCVVAMTVGIILHWVAAAMGPGVGLFGIHAWTGAFVGLAVLIVGLWWWRIGTDEVSSKLRVATKIAAAVVFIATVIGANHILAASWSVVCSEDNPDICLHLGGLTATGGDAETAKHAFDTACSAGKLKGCLRLLQLEPAESRVDSLCQKATRRCTDESLAEPDEQICEELVEFCPSVEIVDP